MLYIISCTEGTTQKTASYVLDQAIERKSAGYLNNLRNIKKSLFALCGIDLCLLIWRRNYFSGL